MKLDEDNFILWKSQIIPSLRGHDLENFILSRGPMLTKNTDPEIEKSEGVVDGEEELNYWIKQDQLLLGWIRAAISREVLRHLVGLQTTLNVWKTLETRYVSYSISQILSRRSQLQSTKKGDMSINDFWLKMKTIADNLEAAGEVVHETDFAFYILGGFGLEFDSVSDNLNSRCVLGQSSTTNSENVSVNPTGLSVSSLESLNFNAANSNGLNSRSVDNSMRHEKFPSTLVFILLIITSLTIPILNILFMQLEPVEGAVCYYRYTQPFQQPSPMLQGSSPRSFLAAMQSSFPINSISALPYTPNLFQLQPQPGFQGQFGHGSQMMVGNFGHSGTQVVPPVPSMYSNALVSSRNFMQNGSHLSSF
ncbi:hypothetical protein FEM48_Zijuj03G0197600 [Ziziphus jujuba var. spinosa]|uniref:Uncharacterized protein n=1 Tax=Ziziphus jujuba var. spinosa TaxID=714518 RepID=A0A978VS95_ZIZJJ|nr:hypothetical protein FEM48_Zijuj03G0197600 [Ziziphus jujuba var. spinosa]